jgi:hypothetical protein
MQRHRRVAAAPKRTSFECWEIISALITSSVAKSKHLSDQELAASLDVAQGVCTALVAGGHLDDHPLTVVAQDLHLSLTTVSGDDATTLDENLNPVPGAAEAKTWMVYLPMPSPLESIVKEITAKDEHLSCADPPSIASAASSEAKSLVNPAVARRLPSAG